MNANVSSFSVSAKTHLRKQVKPRSGGRSQNDIVARGLPV